MAKLPSNSIFKFADDTTVMVSNNDETKYRKEIDNLVTGATTIISPSMSTKRRRLSSTSGSVVENMPDYINGDEVEMVESFKFPGVQITNNLSCFPHADTIVKKAHQRLYFL